MPMGQLVCPASIDAMIPCLCCAEPDHPKLEDRLVACGWDCQTRQWCHLMFTHNVFRQIVEAVKAINVPLSQLESGDGPDVILQRIGLNTIVQVIQESIGQKRGPTPPFKEGEDVPPALNYVLKQLQKKSVWKKTGKIEVVDYPRTTAKDLFDPDADLRDILASLRNNGITPYPLKIVVPSPLTEVSKVPKPNKKSVKRTDVGDDRWDFM